MKARLRKSFDQEPVRKALDDYALAWESLARDQEARAMLTRHEMYLHDELEYSKARHETLTKELAAETDPGSRIVIETALAHANRRVSIMGRAKQQLFHRESTVLGELQAEVPNVMDTLRESDALLFDANGKINWDYIKEGFYAKGSHEPWTRYQRQDGIHESGIVQAIERPDRDERAFELAKVPREIQEKKWRFMLALADAAYGIDIGRLGGESIDPNHLVLLSNLYTRLAENERGADNENMPFTHKFRHNPAIHSLHTLALADEVFHKVLWQINHGTTELYYGKEKYIAKLQQMQSRIFVTALVHDMGEIEGELSQGTTIAHEKDEELKKSIENARNVREEETFHRYLDQNRSLLRHVQNGRLTDEPITDEEWKGIRRLYTDAFELSEKTDVFLGRFFKTLERVQSQHDYLRFQELSGTRPLRQSDEAEKKFSCSYVPKVFYNAKGWNEPPGPKTLAQLAKTGRDDVEIKLQRMLAAETEKVVTQTTQDNIRSYYGAQSPEMQEFRTMGRESRAAAV